MATDTNEDTIRIRGLALDTVIGVDAWERSVQQRLLVDVALRVDLERAARSGALAATIDYGALCEGIKALGTTPRELIETLCADVLDLALRDARVTFATVTIHKPGAVPGAADVSVTMGRSVPDVA